MRKSTVCLLLCSIVLFSCQKEVELNPNPGGGNGTGGDTRNSYNPITVGTWWKYKDSAAGTFITQTMTNKTKTINNILYTGMIGENGTLKDTGWAASPQPNYYMSAKGMSPNTGAAYDITFHYLNDTARVGYTWEYEAGHGNGFTAYIRTSIEEKGIAMTVGGKSYSNIIHTKLVLLYDIFGSITEFGSYDYFIAKGIGIIKVRSELGIFGTQFKSTTDLIDYSIK
jgi:hypothetical protein